MARVFFKMFFYRCSKFCGKGFKKTNLGPHVWLIFWWMVLALPKQSLKHWKEIPFIIYNMALCPLWSLWWLTGARLKNDIQQRSWLNESFCSRWIPKHTCWKQSLIWKSRLRVKIWIPDSRPNLRKYVRKFVYLRKSGQNVNKFT